MRHLLLLATSAYAFVACNRTKVAFYHVPKTGGFSVTNALLAADESCVKLWYILQSEYDIVRRRQDRMHVTPLELENFAKRDNDEDFKQVEVDGVNRKYKTFTVVRNPYTRVLASHDQRLTTELLGKPGFEPQLPGYDRFWPCIKPACKYEPHPTTGFVDFMRWLEGSLANGTLAWCCDPTITHFRPASMFAFWPDDSPAVKKILRQETLDRDLRRAFKDFGLPHTATPRDNVKSSGRSGLCGRSCDACELLRQTNHTPETIRITNRLYARDFELLGYEKITDADLRRCGGRPTLEVESRRGRSSASSSRRRHRGTSAFGHHPRGVRSN